MPFGAEVTNLQGESIGVVGQGEQYLLVTKKPKKPL
ncbi:hypothetical protein AB6H14_09075 [Providencia vermicola]